MDAPRLLLDRGRLHVLVRPIGIAAAIGSLVLLLFVAFAPLVWSDAASTTNTSQLFAPPSAEHWLGTDAAGRDVLARALTATQLSVLLSLACASISVVLGTILGALPVVLPLRGARFVVSAIGFAIAFPSLLLTIIISLGLGIGVAGAVLSIGFAGVPLFARLVYTLSASVAGRDFIAAARVLGVPSVLILFRHVVPNIAGPLLVNASSMVAGSLSALAALSFLGLGVQAPDYDWGRLLGEGLSRIYLAPGIALAPIIAIVFAGVVFMLIGETLARLFGVESTTPRVPRQAPVSQESTAAATAVRAVDEPVLVVRGLTVAVPGGDRWRYPVRNVSFAIARGEIVGLVGESGSGKSLTCLAVGALLEEPIRVLGESIAFDGTELANGGLLRSEKLAPEVEEQLGRRMAFVFQDPSTSLNPALKVGRQVAEPAIIQQKASRNAALQKAISQLRAVRISDPERRAGQFPHEFSGGMRQRAMIAMGLMESPALIVADEPTTALDVTVQQEVLRLLTSVNEQRGTAILLVSHDLAVVAGLCTRVLVMYRGEIVEDILTTDLVAGRARHPYTRALLEVVPDEHAARGSSFATIDEDADFSVQGVRA
jgi:peptide/nickel transport system permease protein